MPLHKDTDFLSGISTLKKIMPHKAMYSIMNVIK